MRTIIFSTLALLTLLASTAMAESIKGRFGITGQVGFIVPTNSEYTRGFINSVQSATGTTLDSQLKADSTFSGGGGLIYGITDNLAVEASVLYTPQLELNNAGVKVMELHPIDVSLGLQIRSNVEKDMAAYLGGGVDFLFNEAEDTNGNIGDVNTVVGGHVNVGGDYFITKHIALNVDLRGVFFPKADIKSGGFVIAQYDPISFIGLVGVRFFVN